MLTMNNMCVFFENRVIQVRFIVQNSETNLQVRRGRRALDSAPLSIELSCDERSRSGPTQTHGLQAYAERTDRLSIERL